MLHQAATGLFPSPPEEGWALNPFAINPFADVFLGEKVRNYASHRAMRKDNRVFGGLQGPPHTRRWRPERAA